MPDEPSSGDGAPDEATTPPGPEGGPHAPPFRTGYRWYGPSHPPDPGTPPYADPYSHPPQTSQRLYGSPYSPYSPYGQPQGGPPYNWPYVPPPPPRPPLSPEERRHRARRASVFAGALLLAVGAGIGIGATIAPTSPATVASTLVNRSIESATKAGTYRYVELSSVFGAPYDIKGDAGLHGGQQVIRQRCRPVQSDTTSATSLFDLRLVRGVVYFRGNLVAVVDELGVAASRATSLAGKWVKLVKGDEPYKSFEEGISAGSNASQLRTAIFPTSSRVVPGSTPPSTEVVGAALDIKHQSVGTAVLVMNTATGLPRTLRGSAVLQDTERYTVTWTFSHYGEKVHVVAPPHPASYSSLHTAPPPKTTCS